MANQRLGISESVEAQEIRAAHLCGPAMAVMAVAMVVEEERGMKIGMKMGMWMRIVVNAVP